MSVEMVALFASILLSQIILFYWDYHTWDKCSILYSEIREYVNKQDDKLLKPELLRKIMNDFNSSMSDSFSWLRRRTIESQARFEYILISIVGNLSFLLFYLVLVIGIYALVIPPTLIIVSGIILFLYKKDWRASWAIVWYTGRSIIIFGLCIGVVEYLSGENPTFIFRTISDTGWHLTIADCSFAFAIGLFIVISLVPALKKYKKIEKNFCVKFREIISENNIKLPTDLYELDSFEEFHNEYFQASIGPRNVKMISGLIVGFSVLGLFCLYYATIPYSNPPVPRPSITELETLTVFGGLLLFTLMCISQLITHEINNPELY